MQHFGLFEFITIVLNGLILPMTGWVLYNVSSVQRCIAVQRVYSESHATEILDLQTRIAAIEAQIIEVRIKVALEEHHHKAQ